MFVADVRESGTVTPWRASTRTAFRFFFAYFTLYVVTTQMLGSLIVLPAWNVPELQALPPVRNLVSWTATHVFRITRPLVITGSGSGDKTFDYVHAFCVLAIAVVATAIWSFVDRRREYQRLDRWFRLFARFALGSTMLSYGMVKLIPLQMPYPSLVRLLEPYGNLSPMGVLWASIGASPAYETLVGCAELAGGVLLLVPRTAMLGALICLFDATQIFALNMTYDVPVKLFSFHLIMLSAVLLAQDCRRLLNVLVLNRTAHPSTQRPLGRTPRQMRIALAVQILFGLYLVGMNLYGARQAWVQYGGGAQKSALYGIWNVDVMTIDGQTRSPLVTDWDRWRRVIFDRPQNVGFQRMNDAVAFFGVQIDPATKSLTLTRNNDGAWRARFSFQQPAPNRLIVDGHMDGRAVRMEMSLVDRNAFLLVNRGFHWVQEYPFNR